MLKFFQGLLGPPKSTPANSTEIRVAALNKAFTIAEKLEARTRDLDTSYEFARNRADVLTEFGVTEPYDPAVHGRYDDSVHYWTDMIACRSDVELFIHKADGHSFRDNVRHMEAGGARQNLVFRNCQKTSRMMKIYAR